MRFGTLAVLCAITLAAGCTIDPPEGVFRCAVDDDCPDGLVCRADRLCYRGRGDVADGGEDASIDASIDGEVPRDAGPPGDSDAGCVDRDGDGVCEADDCDDNDPARSPRLPEACVDDAFVDDDCDGRVDETCSTFIGTPHVPIEAYDEPGPDPTPDAAGHFLFGPWLSVDGLRLYFTGLHASGVGQPLRVASRATLADRFLAPTVVAGTEAASLALAALSDDEQVVVAQSSTETLQMASRAAPSDPFGPFGDATPPPPGGSSQIHPTLRADGLELFYVEFDGATRRLMRAARSSRATSFGTPSLITDAGQPQFPRLSEDALTLYVLLNGALRTLTRADPDGAFGASGPVFDAFVAGGAGGGYAPVFRRATREVFYSRDEGSRGPAGTAIWRARVCRAGPCPTLEVPCDAPDVRSGDGLTCYHRTENRRAIAATRDQCMSWGGTPAAIHSEAAITDSASLRTEELYVDLLRDSAAAPFAHLRSGDPFVFARWAAGEPSSDVADRCVLIRPDGGLDATSCLTSRLGLCMRRRWPTW